MNPEQTKSYDAIVIGASAGGLQVMIRILKQLPVNFNKPVIVVQHRSRISTGYVQHVLDPEAIGQFLLDTMKK